MDFSPNAPQDDGEGAFAKNSPRHSSHAKRFTISQMTSDRFIEIISSAQGFSLLFIIAVLLTLLVFKKDTTRSKTR